MRALVIVFAYFIVGCLADEHPSIGDSVAGNISSSDPLFDPETDIRFQLYTPRNPLYPQIITPMDWSSIENSYFDSSLPTRIFVHGWRAKGNLAARMADSYLRLGNHQLNVIYTNWIEGANSWNYAVVRERVNLVGPFVARFINLLVQRANVKLSDVHIIGHSLGAHAAGIAGKNIENGKVAKIVGLDPARPLFDYNSPNLRLHHTDAHYVESIHTNGGRNGFFETIGQSSFYPNGGRRQPGCWDPVGSCDHYRALYYFLESVYSTEEFYGLWCSSLEALVDGTCELGGRSASMGGELGNLENATGIYFVSTNDQSPFAQGRPKTVL